MSKDVTVTINDQKITVPEGTLVIEATHQMGITVPHFCYHPRLKPIAACRLCLVDITGMRGLQPSCITPVKDGMVVRTDTAPALESHAEVLDLVLENHPLDCPKCEAAGRCQLEDFTYEFGPHRVSNYKPPGLSGIDYQEVAWSPLLKFDPYKCVECTRCVRVCDEVQDCSALTSENRGHSFLITTFADGPLHCDFCGACASVCPTGAIEQQPSQYFKKDWEYLEREAICTHCAHGCTLVLKTWDEKIAKVDDDFALGINKGNVCSRGRFGFDVLDVKARLRDPMVRDNGLLRTATWEEALGRAADIINKAERVEGIASGTLSVEDLFAFSQIVKDPMSDSRDGDVSGYLGSRPGVNFDEIGNFKTIVVVDIDVEKIDYVVQTEIVKAAREKGVEIHTIGTVGARIANHASKTGAKISDYATAGGSTLFVLDAERVSTEVLDAVSGKSILLLASQSNSRALGPLGYSAFDRARSGETFVVAGPIEIAERPAAWKNLIMSAHYLEGLAEHADVLFPAALAYEKPGTTINSEGRSQFSAAAVKPQGYAWPDAAIWARLGNLLGRSIPQTPQGILEAAQAAMKEAQPKSKTPGTTHLRLYGKHEGRLLGHSQWTKTMIDHLETSRDFAPWPA